MKFKVSNTTENYAKNVKRKKTKNKINFTPTNTLSTCNKSWKKRICHISIPDFNDDDDDVSTTINLLRA